MLTPWEISSVDLEIIKETLCHYPFVVDCLEWGAGGSTVLFPQWFKLRRYTYTSIEHDPVWRQRVADELNDPDVTVSLVRCDGDPHREPMDEYVDYPFSLGKRFDFIFIDGRKRRRCLIAASKLLKVGGVVVLHDADRDYYHCAFDHFTKHERIGDKLWRGWIDV